MATYLVACDETAGPDRKAGSFTIGGWLGDQAVWDDWFQPAWSERVLQGPPTIPYFHVNELRDSTWRSRHGLAEHQAERRLDEAVRVLVSTGNLYPVTVTITHEHFATFASALKGLREVGVIARQPDYMAFVWFALTTVERVSRWCPEATRVNFLVERKEVVSHHVAEFHSQIASLFGFLNRSHLSALVGDLRFGGKADVPLQAADLLCWHLQRFESGKSRLDDRRRLSTLIRRPGQRLEWPEEEVLELATALRRGASKDTHL